MKALIPLLVLAACKCPPKSTTAPPATTPAPQTEPPGSGSPGAPGGDAPAGPGSGPGQAPPGSGSAAEPAPSWPTQGGAARPGIGETCGDADACAQGLTCVAYYGIAGPRGPQFKTCEIKCQDNTACPADFKCVTIADGPGQVCRK